MQNVFESVASNQRKSWLVVVGFITFVSVSVYFLAMAIGAYSGYQGSGLGIAGVALIIAGLSSLFSYYYSDRIILTLSNARPADRKRDFHFFTATQNLSLAAGLPMPKLYVISDTALNAFATGRDPNHGVICVTTGLLTKLNRTELEGVIAHEMSHIANYDTRLMSLVTVLIGLITLLADWLLRASWFSGGDDRDAKNTSGLFMVIGFVLALLSPLVAQLIQLAISRRREYLADASAVKLTRQPSGLTAALSKLGEDTEPLEAANKATAHLYIVNPLKNRHDAIGMFATLFATHPPLSDRIRALQAMR